MAEHSAGVTAGTSTNSGSGGSGTTGSGTTSSGSKTPTHDSSVGSGGRPEDRAGDETKPAEAKAKGAAKDAERQARQTARDAKRKARRAGSQIKDQAYQAKEKIKAEGMRAFASVKDRSVEAVHERKDAAASEVGTIAAAIRSASDKLRDENDEGIASYVDSAADAVDSLASYVGDSDFTDFYYDAQSWAKRHPALFLSGIAVVGFAAARFFKASDERDWETRYGSYGDEHLPQPRYDDLANRYGGGSTGARTRGYGGATGTPTPAGIRVAPHGGGAIGGGTVGSGLKPSQVSTTTNAGSPAAIHASTAGGVSPGSTGTGTPGTPAGPKPGSTPSGEQKREH